jgi:hypothetical protein
MSCYMLSHPPVDLAHHFHNPQLCLKPLLCDFYGHASPSLWLGSLKIWEREILSDIMLTSTWSHGHMVDFILVHVGAYVAREKTTCHWAQGVVLDLQWVPFV